MNSWRTLAIAGITLGAILAAAIARDRGLDASIPLAIALVAVALLGAAGRRQGALSYEQLVAAARAHYAAGVRPVVVPWEELSSRRKRMEIDAIQAALQAAEQSA